MEVKARRQRVVSTKYSKSACRTCRIRRVKCDETRPSCKNCVSTGRTCDGYDSSNTTKGNKALSRTLLPASSTLLTTAVSRPLSQLTFLTTPEDEISFRFFTDHVVWGLELVSPSPEWITLALQLSSTQPCIYFAIAACGSVANARLSKQHHCFFTPSSPVREKRNLRQYCKATAALQKYINLAACGKGTIEPVLLCCLLCVSYETKQDENVLAVQHLKFGERAIKESAAGGLSFSSKQIRKDVVSAFDWLGAEILRFEDDEIGQKKGRQGEIARYSAKSSMLASIEYGKKAVDRLAAAASSWRSELLAIAADYVATLNLPNLRPAILECIIHCVSRSLSLPSEHPLVQRQHQLGGLHQAWLQQLAAVQTASGSTNRRALIDLQIKLFYSTFILATARDTHAKQTDRFNDQASVILDLVEEFLAPYPTENGPKRSPTSNKTLNPYSPLPQQQEYCFSLEYTIVPILFAICLKIRHSRIRRRALQLLQSANRREAGQWSGELCHYADAMIALEESSGGLVVPESARSLEVVIEASGYLQVSLVCGRFRIEGDGRLEVVEYKGVGSPPLRLQKVKENVFPFGLEGVRFVDVDQSVDCYRRERLEQDYREDALYSN